MKNIGNRKKTYKIEEGIANEKKTQKMQKSKRIKENTNINI